MKHTIAAAIALVGIGLVLGAFTSSSSKSGTSSPTSAPATTGPAMTPSATPPKSSGTVAAWLVASGTYVREAGEGPVELFTRLTGGSAFARAAGWSENDQEGNFRELDVWLANVGGLAGRQVTVYLNGHKAGTMHVSSTGRGFRKWDTEHGQSVPFGSAGSRVEVRAG